jgi:hypothetical protein
LRLKKYFLKYGFLAHCDICTTCLIFLQNNSPLAYNNNKIINDSWEIKIITCLCIEKLGKFLHGILIFIEKSIVKA